MAPRREGGFDESDLTRTINEEMVDLKMFLKAERKDATPDADSNIKNFFRDKYRQKYLAASNNASSAPNKPAQPAPKPAQQQLAASTGVTGGYSPRHAVDSALAHTGAQVGAQENVGWTPEMPDGWGKGYSYQYSRDSIPSAARGVPLPATFGGRGGGGKRTSQLSQQEAQGRNEYERRCNRPSSQKTSEWVTWGGAFPRDERMGNAPWRYCQTPSSGCKRGRNVATDAQQSVRGGDITITSSRVGMHAPPDEVSNPGYYKKFTESSRRHPDVAGWYSPAGHASSAHPIIDNRRDPALHIRSEYGTSNLGGGKFGRNHAKEQRDQREVWLSPQARPQVAEYGTATGGGSKGRNPMIDARQSSSHGVGPLIC